MYIAAVILFHELLVHILKQHDSIYKLCDHICSSITCLFHSMCHVRIKKKYIYIYIYIYIYTVLTTVRNWSLCSSFLLLVFLNLHAWGLLEVVNVLNCTWFKILACAKFSAIFLLFFPPPPLRLLTNGTLH